MLEEVTVKIEQSVGSSGRSFIILHEQESCIPEAKNTFEVLGLNSRVFRVSSSKISTDTWKSLSEQLFELLGQTGVRQFSVVAFGATSTLAQTLYLKEPKLIRAMILIDATYRPHPTYSEKIIDWLENKFTLGLPLRSEGKQFNSLSHLQRIRCPVLIVNSKLASNFDIEQSKNASVRMPTCWHVQLDDMKELADIVLQFQDTPAKCPQKRKVNTESLPHGNTEDRREGRPII